VFTGRVDRVRETPAALWIDALEATAPLLDTFRTQTYSGQSVDAIVRDLAADVDIADVQGDMDLAQYSVDGRRNVWGHLRDLARLAGCDLRAAPDGGLLFSPPGGGETFALYHGIDLLSWERGEAIAAVPATVRAHGAASAAGARRWHWLNADVAEAESAPHVTPGAVATTDAAEAASGARAAAADNMARLSQAVIWGRPEIRAGDTVTLNDLPEPGGGGLLESLGSLVGGAAEVPGYRVRGLRHRLHRAAGFTTALELVGGKSGTDALGALAGAIGGLGG
jgi:hypothetical protein